MLYWCQRLCLCSVLEDFHLPVYWNVPPKVRLHSKRTGLFDIIWPCWKARGFVAVPNICTLRRGEKPVIIERGEMWWKAFMMLHSFLHSKSESGWFYNEWEKNLRSPNFACFLTSTQLSNQMLQKLLDKIWHLIGVRERGFRCSQASSGQLWPFKADFFG